MNEIATTRARKRCAVYCRVSSDERLDQEFNSIDAQKEAGHAYIASQRAEGWIPVTDDYDDPGFSGGNTDRPALKRLLADIDTQPRRLRQDGGVVRPARCKFQCRHAADQLGHINGQVDAQRPAVLRPV